MSPVDYVIAQFSIAHNITGDAAWMTALVLMAFGEVLARVLVLQIQRVMQSAGSGWNERPRTASVADHAVREHQLTL